MFVWCPADYLTPGGSRSGARPRAAFCTRPLSVGINALAEAVAAAFRASSFYAEAKTDIMRWKYRKLLSNLGNAVDALCGPRREAAASRSARGAKAWRAFRPPAFRFVADDEEDAARLEREVQARTIDGVERRGGSSWQSLERQARHDRDGLSQRRDRRLGRRHGVPTPVNALLQYLSQRVARERRAPGSVNPDKILIALDLRQNPLQ